jgi:hypothetical protein
MSLVQILVSRAGNTDTNLVSVNVKICHNIHLNPECNEDRAVQPPPPTGLEFQ